MSFDIITLPFFDKQIKRLVKKYPSLKAEYAQLIADIANGTEQGTPLGNQTYKIRLAIASKGKGKSGGARVITYMQVIQNTVYLVSIYDKAEQSTLSAAELKEIIKSIPQ